MSQRAALPTIRFEATLYTIGKWTILRLPEKASGKLPSRGQVAVQGTLNGHGFQTVLEPDGYLGHWMRIDGELQRAAAIGAGDTATLEIEPLKDWPEPNVPQDLEAALAAAPPKIQDLWEAITPMARWEWVRWVNATGNPDTRNRTLPFRVRARARERETRALSRQTYDRRVPHPTKVPPPDTPAAEGQSSPCSWREELNVSFAAQVARNRPVASAQRMNARVIPVVSRTSR